MFWNEHYDARALSYFNVGGSGAHTVLPYRLVREATNPGRFRLYVYDSNNPLDDSKYILIDSTANTWQDFTGLGWGPGNNRCYLEPPSSDFLETPEMSTRETGLPVKSRPVESGYIELATPPNANINIRNDAGETIGYQNGVVSDDLSAGIAIIPKVGTAAPPLGYYLADESYSVEMGNYPDTLSYLTLFRDSVIYGFERLDAQPEETDLLSADQGLSFSNADSGGKRVTLSATATDDTSDRTFILTGMTSSGGDSLHMRVNKGERLQIANAGAGKEYELQLQFTTGTLIQRFSHSHITLQPGASHFIRPDWEQLESEPVTILVDEESDGSIDDSLQVENEPTGVEDQTAQHNLPDQYALLQNYPNPFNPVTTITYHLPQQGQVRLTIYNILGEQIQTLVEQEHPAGAYSHLWDGTDASGRQVASGVYLYRLETGSRVFTRRMLLLK